MIFDVAVVGSGLIGAAAARHASRSPGLLAPSGGAGFVGEEDVRVCLIGPEEPSSFGETDLFASHYDEGRICRRTDPDPIWAELASRSMDRFDDIVAQSGGICFYVQAGHLAVGRQGSKTISDRIGNAAAMEVSFAALETGAALRDRYPFLRFPLDDDAVAAVYEPDAGHLSPRALRKAQIAAALKSGNCRRIPYAADKVDDDPDGEGGYVITLDDPDKTSIRARRVVVAAGAFTNARPLLPDGKGGHYELDLRCYTAQTVHFHLTEEDARALMGGDGMPSVIYRTDDEWAYALPPIRYPDGSWRVKLGGGRSGDEGGGNADDDDNAGRAPGTKLLDTPDDVVSWFRSKGDPGHATVLESMLRSLLPPDVEPAKVTSDSCATTKTATGLPYVGEIRPGLCVATGGCGLAAKSSDEIGRLGALAVLSSWENDDDEESSGAPRRHIRRDLFEPQVKGRLGRIRTK